LLSKKSLSGSCEQVKCETNADQHKYQPYKMWVTDSLNSVPGFTLLAS